MLSCQVQGSTDLEHTFQQKRSALAPSNRKGKRTYMEGDETPFILTSGDQRETRHLQPL